MNTIKDIVDFKAGFWKYDSKHREQVYYEYEKGWFCDENKVIHNSVKAKLNCCECGFSLLEKMEFEALKRLQWFTDNYFKLSLNRDFSLLSTDEICKNYKLKIRDFKPWI